MSVYVNDYLLIQNVPNAMSLIPQNVAGIECEQLKIYKDNCKKLIEDWKVLLNAPGVSYVTRLLRANVLTALVGRLQKYESAICIMETGDGSHPGGESEAAANAAAGSGSGGDKKLIWIGVAVALFLFAKQKKLF